MLPVIAGDKAESPWTVEKPEASSPLQAAYLSPPANPLPEQEQVSIDR